MKPTERLATATAPDGSLLALYRHDGAYTIVVDGVELMSSRRTHSEVVLAERACAALRATPAPRVLIGGLGLGATLRAALAALPADARVTLVEILPEVIAWNTNAEYGLSTDAMRDPRVAVHRDDVRHVLGNHPGAFDAIMMDVDNGAESFTTTGNQSLYSERGVRRTVAALRPGGRIVYWSVDREPAFVALVRRLGLSVQTEQVRSHATSGGFNTLITVSGAVEQAPAR
jgi:spermidine synthase